MKISSKKRKIMVISKKIETLKLKKMRKNILFLIIVSMPIFNVFAQLNYGIIQHNLVAVDGDFLPIDTDGDGLHDRLIGYGVEGNSMLKTRVYDFDGVNETFIQTGVLPDVGYGKIIQTNLDGLHGPDLLIIGTPNLNAFNQNPFAEIRLDDGNGGYTVSQTLVGLYNVVADFIDIDNDGDADLRTSGLDASSRLRSIIYQNVNGVFTKIIDDIGSNGTNTTLQSNCYVMVNNNNGTFEVLRGVRGLLGDDTILVFNEFGRYILKVSNNNSDIYFVNSDGITESVSSSIPNHTNTNILEHDFNSDGDFDYYVAGFQSPTNPTAGIYLDTGSNLMLDPNFIPAERAYGSSVIITIPYQGVTTNILLTTGSYGLGAYQDTLLTEMYALEESTLGITDINNSSDDIYFYPNPATTEIHLILPEEINLKEVVIYNFLGKIVRRYDKNQLTQNTSLLLPDLASGMYALHMVTNNKVVSKKLIIR